MKRRFCALKKGDKEKLKKDREKRKKSAKDLSLFETSFELGCQWGHKTLRRVLRRQSDFPRQKREEIKRLFVD